VYIHFEVVDRLVQVQNIAVTKKEKKKKRI